MSYDNRLLDNHELADAIESMSRGDRIYILTAKQIRDFPVNVYDLYLEGKLHARTGINKHVIRTVLRQLENTVSA